jgi:16S rRNA (cytidine1402-2'-O)-methyltransferase
MQNKGTLYICPTPIGNLKDITLRTLEVLKEVNYIACEDKRRALKLLNTYDIKKPLILYNEHTKDKENMTIKSFLLSGNDVALTCDAGMPGIADSGYELIKLCIASEIKVVTLPGPSAILTSLVGSGLNSQNFVFINFLPRKKGQILNLLKNLKSLGFTVCAFESPYRLLKTLEVMYNFDSNLNLCVCREISKIHEEFVRGNINSVYTYFKEKKMVKGEITIVFKFMKEGENE